jgi:hypothetical protein
MKKVLMSVLLIGIFSVASWASGVGGGYVNVYYSTSTAHNNFSNLNWSVAGHVMDDTLTDNFGLNTTTLTVSGISTLGGNVGLTGNMTTSGVYKAGSGVVILTNANGNILPAILAAGSLPATVIVSSIQAGSMFPEGFRAGTCPSTVIVSSIQAGTPITAASIMAGNLASTVIISSIQAGTTIGAADVRAGNLPATVIISSIQAGTTIGSTDIRAGALPATVIVSSMQAGIPIIFATGKTITNGTYTIAVSTDLAVTGRVASPRLNLSSAYEIGIDTPIATGSLVRNAAFVLYITTGTSNSYDYIKVGAQ